MEYYLYVDELGESTPSRYRRSSHFILSGCIVSSDRKTKLIKDLDQIKFKFWDSTDIILHSANIGRKDKEFSIFNGNLTKFNEFTKNLNVFLNTAPFSLIAVIADQRETHLQNWDQQKVLKEAYRFIIKNFIRFLVASNSQGMIIQEASTPPQDITAYENFYYYQSAGIKEDSISHEEVKKRLTGISFVTKRNEDPIAQLADIIGYGVKLEELVTRKKKKVSDLNNYQKMIRSCAINKKFYIDPNTGKEKKRIYKNFKAIEKLP